MNDMRAVIVPKSDQINADDLIAGPLTITITKVDIRPGTEQPVSISFDGDGGKPYKPCKSMARVMVNCWGPDASKYIGQSMTLYRDPAVKWGGMEVGGIRISHMTGIERAMTMALTATKGSKKAFVVKPLVMERAPTAAAIDKVTAGVTALIARIKDADEEALKAITSDDGVKKQRAWLAKNRAELNDQIGEAISARMAVFEGADQPPPAEDDGWPADTGEMAV